MKQVQYCDVCLTTVEYSRIWECGSELCWTRRPCAVCLTTKTAFQFYPSLSKTPAHWRLMWRYFCWVCLYACVYVLLCVCVCVFYCMTITAKYSSTQIQGWWIMRKKINNTALMWNIITRSVHVERSRSGTYELHFSEDVAFVGNCLFRR